MCKILFFTGLYIIDNLNCCLDTKVIQKHCLIPLSGRYYSHCSTWEKIATNTIGDNHKSYSFIFLLFVHYFRLSKRINALDMEGYGSLIAGQLLYNLCLLRSYSCMGIKAFTMHQNPKSNILAVRRTRTN